MLIPTSSAVAVDPRTERLEFLGPSVVGDITQGADADRVVSRHHNGPCFGVGMVGRRFPLQNQVIAGRADVLEIPDVDEDFVEIRARGIARDYRYCSISGKSSPCDRAASGSTPSSRSSAADRWARGPPHSRVRLPDSRPGR